MNSDLHHSRVSVVLGPGQWRSEKRGQNVMTIEKQIFQTNCALLKLTKIIARLIIPRSKNMKAYKNIKKGNVKTCNNSRGDKIRIEDP